MTLDERIKAAAHGIRDYCAEIEVKSNGEATPDPMEHSLDYAESAIRAAFPELFGDVAKKSREKNKAGSRPDFGEIYALHENVLLGCRAVAPNLSMQELTAAFEDAKKQAKPEDSLSANPGKWPDVRGVKAVVETLLDAIYGK